MATPDLEKGLDSQRQNNFEPTDVRRQSLGQNLSDRNPHFKSELQIFQGLVGINFLKEGGLPNDDAEPPPIVSPLRSIFMPSRTAKQRMRNRGLYNRAVTQDLKNRSMYAITHYIISGLYLLQVLVAATLTALSAYQQSSTVVLTVLGALNTVIAGLLAWLTGQGMPTRYRRARDQYREVLRACEAMERRFAQIDHIHWPDGQRPDPVIERDKLNKMFEDARKDQEANYPDSATSPQSDKDKEDVYELREELAKWKTKKKRQEEKFQALKRETEVLRNLARGEKLQTS
jgi:Zn-finger nucleic acid-binding protein